MKTHTKDRRLFILPVRRRLMTLTMAYLGGILSAQAAVCALEWAWILCAFLLVCAAMRRRRRKSAFFAAVCLMLLLGNVRAGMELEKRDCPTQPGAKMEGRICSIEKAYRVRLTDVTIDGEPAAYARDVLVTLMREENGETPDMPEIGQYVSGEGRLFALEAKRNPGGVEWRIQAICKGYELSGYLLPGWTAQGEARFSLGEGLRRLRVTIIDQTERLFGSRAALFQGIMLGDKSALDDEVTAAMRLTGTVHVLTVSGLHLSMIAGIAGLLLERLSVRRRSRFVLLGGFLVFFTLLTGGAPGTIRACIMVLLRELAVLRGRRYEPLTALSFAALCMTFVQPLWLLHASFQFSFFSVLGIQLFSVGISSFLRRHVSACPPVQSLLDAAALSLSAQMAAIPMQLMLYGYVPLLSLPMNVICGTVLPFLLLGGWAAVLLSFVWMPAGALLAGTLSAAAHAFEAFSLAGASVGGAIVRLPAPYGITVLLVMVMMLLLTRRIRLGGLRRTAAWVMLCLITVSYLPRFDPRTRYVQLDVGQGDAAIIRSGRRAVMMDVGPTDSYETLRYLRHEGLFVDAVLLSHLDEDHAGALGVLLDSEVDIPWVIMAQDAQFQNQTAEVEAAIQTLAYRNIAQQTVKQGDRIEIGRLIMDVLSPDDSLYGSNERSLLVHAQAEGVSILFTGDLPAACEPDSVPDVNVLKVAHHGSKNSTSDAFLASASPEAAVISVGEGNWYGHPHMRVLDSLAQCGAQIYRTDLDGCVTMWLRDGNWLVGTRLEAWTYPFEHILFQWCRGE